MKEDKDIFNFFVDIRERVQKLLYEVRDSNILYISQKNTWEFEKPIREIINDVQKFTKKYGLFYVDVFHHSDYEAVFDSKDILGKYYQMDELYSKYSNSDSILYSKYYELRDERIESIKCPLCNKNKKKHKIVTGYIITENKEFCILVKDFVNCLYDALEHCVYNGKRSYIRENLLHSMLALNDIIMPVTVDEYIKSMKENKK